MWREDAEEDLSSYLTLRKKEGTGNWKRNQSIELCGELTSEEDRDLSLDIVQYEWVSTTIIFQSNMVLT
jgi:hypothetical protein